MGAGTVKQPTKVPRSFSPEMIEITRIRACVLKYIRQWLNLNSYLEVCTPVIVRHPIQSELSFKLRYFDMDAFISHNNQLYLEKASFSVGNAWTLNPSFRSEEQETERHLSEFLLLQSESLYLKDLDDVLQIQENLICYLIELTIKERIDSFNFLKIDSDLLKRIQAPFGRMRYDQAIEILREKEVKTAGKNRVFEWGDDFDIDAEREVNLET